MPKVRTPLKKRREDREKRNQQSSRMLEKVSTEKPMTARRERERRRNSADRSSTEDEDKRIGNKEQRVVRERETSRERNTILKSKMKPDKYDDNTPLEIFLLQFDNCVEHNGWGMSERLAQLKGALRGTAAQVLMGSHGASIGYDALREELQKCFGIEGYTAQYQVMLKTRRRQAGESLRTLYQDICRLLMLAYPGPQNDLRDLLAVEAFTDSLDDVELQVSVKDKFPKNLAEAFQAALRLEANRPSARKSKDERRPGKPATETQGRNRNRDDIESRRVEWHEENAMGERLAQLELAMKDSKVEAQRNREREAELARINRMEGQIQAMELKSRLIENTMDRDRIRPEGVDGVVRAGNQSATGLMTSVESVGPNAAAAGRTDETRWRNDLQEGSQAGSGGDKRDTCSRCHAINHALASCPQAYCGNCDSMGHTRRVCKVSLPRGGNRPPPGPCPHC